MARNQEQPGCSMSPRTPAQCLVLDLQSAEARLRGLKDSERLSLLVRLLADSDPHHLRAELIQRVKRAVTQPDELVPGSRPARRTVRDLLAAAARRAEARARAAPEKAERERQQLARALRPPPAPGIWKDSSGIPTNYGSKSKHLPSPNVKPTTPPRLFKTGSGPARRIGATATARYVHASAAAASGAACEESQPARPPRSCATCIVL